MRSITKKGFVLINLIILWGFVNTKYLAETKKQSIINLLCLNNFKEQMFKANIVYDDKIARDTCDCYFEEFSKKNSHQKAITKCKLKSQEKFNL